MQQYVEIFSSAKREGGKGNRWEEERDERVVCVCVRARARERENEREILNG